MDKDTRYRLALINMAQGAQRQADACRSFVPVIIATQPADDREEQAQAYERVAQLLCNEADDMKRREPG